MDGQRPLVRWAVHIGLAVVLTGCFPGHEEPPSLDGPAKSLTGTSCESVESFTPLAEVPPKVKWSGNVKFLDPLKSQRVVAGDVNMTIKNVASESSTFIAFGGAKWTAEFPYDVERAFGMPGTIVAQMSWYHAVGIGDEIGDSGTVIAGIDAADGKVRWWYPYDGRDAPPRLLVAGPDIAIVLVFHSSIPCTYVHAVDTVTGDQRWAVGVEGKDLTVLAAAFDTGVVHLSLANHGVVDLDVATGDIVP